MTSDVTSPHCDPERARELVDMIRAGVSVVRDALIEAFEGRAWVALGYADWQSLCDAEFGVRVQLPREQRRELVGELREAGLSTRAIGSALDVAPSTVREDLGTGGRNRPPERVTGTDGKSYQPESDARKRAAEAAALAERYTELAYYAEAGRTDDVIRLGNALQGYSEPELSMRRDNLRKKVAAEQRRDAAPEIEQGPDYVDLASRMFTATNAAAQEAERAGGADSVIRALDTGIDPLLRSTWHDQFASFAATCNALAQACKSPSLRRVR